MSLPLSISGLVVLTLAVSPGCSRIPSMSGEEKKFLEANHSLHRIKRLRNKAASGRPRDQLKLGLAYLDMAEPASGRFISQHVSSRNKHPSDQDLRNHNRIQVLIYDLGRDWLIKAAKQENLQAQVRLVEFYTSPRRQQTMKRSSKHKSIEARMRPAWKQSIEVTRENTREAEKWCRLAATQDHIHSQVMLADMLSSRHELNGRQDIQNDVEDIPEAYRWYRKAAEAGHPRACELMAELYHSGRSTWYQKTGISADDLEALAWYEVTNALNKKYSQPAARWSRPHPSRKNKFELTLEKLSPAEVNSVKERAAEILQGM